MAQHSEICLQENGAGSKTTRALASRLNEPRFGYLSAKDQLLLIDAVSLACDAFLTMDGKLAKNAAHLQREVGIAVLTPPEFAVMLRPWMGLFR